MTGGVSSACLYPWDTAESLEFLEQGGVRFAEIFLNTCSEMKEPYLQRLERLHSRGVLKLVSLHPFTSQLESFFFATDYPTRQQDGFAFYRQYFKMCKRLGIQRLVMHGMSKGSPFPFEKYCENYLRLREMGREYNVDVMQENVVRCACSDKEHILQMRRYTRQDVSFVLDFKQARRAQIAPLDMFKAMGTCTRHIHFSDATATHDCLMPNSGTEDFAPLLLQLCYIEYEGYLMLELYRENFTQEQELFQGYAAINRLLAQLPT